jgi:hypothetical protein
MYLSIYRYLFWSKIYGQALICLPTRMTWSFDLLCADRWISVSLGMQLRSRRLGQSLVEPLYVLHRHRSTGKLFLRLNRVSSTVGQYDTPTHTTAGHLERIVEEQQGPARREHISREVFHYDMSNRELPRGSFAVN